MGTPSSNAQIHWDDQQQPVSSQFDDVYFSRDNGLEETRYVFIDNNQLTDRWNMPSSNKLFTIGETGFGTGLNFLVTWQLWRQCSPRSIDGTPRRLHYISAEKHPLHPVDLEKALSLWPQLSKLSGHLMEHYPPQPGTGVKRILFDHGNVALTLYLGDASEGFRQFGPCDTSGTPITNRTDLAPQTQIDAWFLDGFAPAKNPTMWQPDLFEAISRLSREGTTFATFTAAGMVRRGLQSVGFECSKVRGYGRKRDMLRGTFVAPAETLKTATSNVTTNKDITEKRIAAQTRQRWHLRSASATPQTALVIGAGLAGSQIAHALAKRNVQVTVLERHNLPATEASGNRQGAVYARLSPHPDPLSQFNLEAQIFADHFYKITDSYAQCGERCGILHLAQNEKQQTYYRQLAEKFRESPSFCKWLTKTEAAEIAGIAIHHDGLYVASTGWLRPANLCKHLLEHDNIRVHYNSAVDTLVQNGDLSWSARSEDGSSLANADIAVIANAYAARRFEQTAYLPLKSIRGQVTHVDTDTQKCLSAITTLKTVLCGEGYISPLDNGTFCLGATFNLNATQTALCSADQQTNFRNLENLLAMNLDTSEAPLAGRTAFRTTTPDYFPIAGPIPVSQAMHKIFAALRHNAQATIHSAGEYYPGLYTLLGLGSRGLAYGPLTAELLASDICSESLPINRQLALMLHPARFLIRDLIRNKATTL